MHRKPYVIGIDASLARAESRNPERMMELLGINTGNIVFSEALYRCIGGAHRGNYDFLTSDLEQHDAVVLAAANWLNSYDDFGWLADKLENVKAPVIIVGLGAQSPSTSLIPELKPGTRRLIDIISSKSAMISVRGRFSAEVLIHYGIKNFMITGCPSLLLCGRRGPSIRTLSKGLPSRCIITSTRFLMSNTDDFQLYLYRQAMKHDFHIVLQSELADYYAMHNEGKLTDHSIGVLLGAYGANDVRELKCYLNRRARMFLSLDEWIDFASTKDFCVGTRIHGAVVSLLAGTPATLITHDTRTQELALAMNIPHRPMSAIDTGRDLSIEDMYSADEISTFVKNYKAYRDNFEIFFVRNGLLLVEENASLMDTIRSNVGYQIEAMRYRLVGSN
jgi:polysaccharide pyruvyl transferase